MLMTVNDFAAGLVNTAILRNLSEEALMEFSRQVSIGRIGRPEEIAEAALYFALDEAAYVTGQILNRSGGTII
jgi:NAD(P)-dependent dehydrogenase (short-subunit alcohol dehydrogenase family)